MKSINIVAMANGVGISRDIEIIRQILTKDSSFNITISHPFKMNTSLKYDLNIFLERFNPPNLNTAKLNCMLPNQEWFELAWLPLARKFDLIFTKTKFADNIFKTHGFKTEYVSFTSEDRWIPYVKKDNYHWLHLAGKSVQKQTEVVIKTWQRNPGFPQLTIIQDPKFWRPRMTLRNVNFMNDRVPEDLLQTIQNVSSVHVCPSETEGFGHYIMEAMSSKSLVITTNGPPMNELVTEERGVWVNPVKTEPMRLSMSYFINEKSLEDAVIRTTMLSHKYAEFGQKGREYYLQNDTFFKNSFSNSIHNLLQT